MTETARNPLSQRLAFYHLSAQDPDFARLSSALDRHGKAALDRFYQNVSATPETAGFFPNREAIDRAHNAQSRHWKTIFDKGLGDAYVAATNRIGDIHSRIGLEPKWYLGGYANILEHMITGILTEGSRSYSPRRRADAKLVATLVKVAILDMDMAITRYFEAEDARRSEVVSILGKTLTDVSNGDLTTEMPPLPKDFASIEPVFRGALDRIIGSLTNIAASSAQLLTSAGEMRAASDDLARRTEVQAAALEESSAAIRELSDTVADTDRAIGDLAQSVQRTHQVAEGGEKTVKDAIAAMDEIERGASEIGKIIGMIEDIAFQTNLLALNAGVEAARVGEHGRGFAVVANEVRSLAQSSASAAEQIRSLIRNSNTQVDHGARMVQDVGRALFAIMEEVKRTSDVTGRIAEQSAAQSTNLRQVNSAINEMSETTQRNAAMAEESNAAVHQMEGEASHVARTMAQFRLRGQPKLGKAA